MTGFTTLLLVLAGLAGALAQNAPPDRGLFNRLYQEGEEIVYRMKGVNGEWRYEVLAKGVVKRDSKGHFFEEFAWSDLISNGSAVALPPENAEFSQVLSLDPDNIPRMPDLSRASPMLIGPITDMMAFYVDFWLVIRLGSLKDAGDRLYQESGTAASWADGARVILGEDSFDFDITLSAIDRSNNVATLMVRHVPPARPKVRLPAPWMRKPVADTPNNWVNVSRKGAKYIVEVGKETFDVELRVSLADGKILSGIMVNPVQARRRECAYENLVDCGNPEPREIMRRIEISLER